MSGWIDLSHPLDSEVPRIATFPAPSYTTVMELPDDPMTVTRMDMVVHTGTHVDAPSHFVVGGESVDQLDLARLTGAGVVCRVVTGVIAARIIGGGFGDDDLGGHARVDLAVVGISAGFVEGEAEGFAGRQVAGVEGAVVGGNGVGGVAVVGPGHGASSFDGDRGRVEGKVDDADRGVLLSADRPGAAERNDRGNCDENQCGDHTKRSQTQ